MGENAGWPGVELKWLGSRVLGRNMGPLLSLCQVYHPHLELGGRICPRFGATGEISVMGTLQATTKAIRKESALNTYRVLESSKT